MNLERVSGFFLFGARGRQAFQLVSPYSPEECARRINAALPEKEGLWRLLAPGPIVGTATSEYLALRRPGRNSHTELQAALIAVPDGTSIAGNVIVSQMDQGVILLSFSGAVLISGILISSLLGSLLTGGTSPGDFWQGFPVPMGMMGFFLIFRFACIVSLGSTAEYFRSYLLHAIEAREPLATITSRPPAPSLRSPQ